MFGTAGWRSGNAPTRAVFVALTALMAMGRWRSHSCTAGRVVMFELWPPEHHGLGFGVSKCSFTKEKKSMCKSQCVPNKQQEAPQKQYTE